MAHRIANASLDGIFERLNTAPEYHPLNASTFSDWTVEAGDMVTVSRNGENYDTPVHSSKLVWKGAPQVEISSTGNKERDSVSKMSRQKYGRGGTAVRSSEGIYSYIYSSESVLCSYVDQTASYIVLGVQEVASSLGSELLITASQIRSEVHASNSQLYSYVDQTATYIESVVADTANDLGSAILQTASEIRSEVHAANSQLYSYVDQTATYIESVVADTANDLGSAILQTASEIRSEVHASNSQLYSYVDQTATYIQSEVASTASGLSSRITQQADRISMVVDGSGNIKAASIAAAINQQTGQSVISLSADIIDMDGLVEKLESRYVETTGLTTTYLTPSVIDLEDTTIESTRFQGSAGKLVIGVSKDPVSGEVTLTQIDGTTTTFSRATPGGEKLSGSWSGATLTVSHAVTGVDTFTSVLSTGFVTDTNVTPNTYHITAYRRDNNADQPTEIQSARSQYKLGVLSTSKTTVRILNSAGTTYINGTPTYTIPLTTLSATSNGTYTPTGDNIGYSSVTVNVPNDLANARVRFSGSSGQYYYEAFDSVSGTSVSGSSVTYHLGRSGTKVQIQDTEDTKINGTMEYTIPLTTKSVTANGTYTPSSSYVGFSSVSVNVPNDYSNVRVRFSGSSGQYYYEAFDSSTSTSISGSSVTYKLGRSGTKVQIQNSSGSKISGTMEFTIPLTTKTVTANGTYTPSSSYVGFSSVTVNVPASTPTVNTWSLTYKSSPYTYTASVKVNGTTYTSGNLSATNAYDNGWSAAYGKVVLPASGTSSSVTVKTPASTSGGGTSGQITNTYKLSVAVGYAYLKNGSTTVGRVAHSYAYTSAEYTAYGDAQYESGWKAGWDAFYNDTIDWRKDYGSGSTKSVWTPRKIASFDYWSSPYGRGKGNFSNDTSEKWFEYTTGSSCNHHKVSGTKFKCTVSGTGTGRYYTLTANITSSQYIVNGGEYILYV